jgi:hypothetical protein
VFPSGLLTALYDLCGPLYTASCPVQAELLPNNWSITAPKRSILSVVFMFLKGCTVSVFLCGPPSAFCTISVPSLRLTASI